MCIRDSLSTERGAPENGKNSNQYWCIKMLDILKQLYPEKEYIDIELIGVDLLQDLGIEALDHKLHIHKSKRDGYKRQSFNAGSISQGYIGFAILDSSVSRSL